ncbi:MAG: leucine-rich repeat domain-containing protein, partial [Candidatus Woesearchaeota archaeon]
ENASAMKTVTFETDSQLDIIGDSAFSDAEALSRIVIPESVTSIGDYAFSDAEALTSIVIPESVASIDYGAFGSVDSLTIYAEASEESDDWTDNWNSDNRPVEWGITDYGTKDDLDYVVTEEEKVTIIGQTAIGDATDLSIPDTIDNKEVTTIGAGGFQNNNTLDTIFIPLSITTIDKDAFKDSDLDTIYVEAYRKPDDWDDDWNPDSIDVDWNH